MLAGVTCRFALSHTYSDPAQDILNALPRPESTAPPLTAADPQAADGDAAGAAAAAASTRSLVAPEQCILTVPDSIEKTINTLDKEVQNKLWKHRCVIPASVGPAMHRCTVRCMRHAACVAVRAGYSWVELVRISRPIRGLDPYNLLAALVIVCSAYD
jgi:hypothetical protein